VAVTGGGNGGRRAAGQAVVEFTLVSIALAMLIFGALDLGRGVFMRQMLANAVREAARYGSINRSDTAGMVTSAANRSPSLGLSTASFTFECAYWQTSTSTWVTRTACNSAVKVGERLTVCATYQFGLTAPRLIGWSSIAMRECAQTTIQ
jgi:Flp pilus assembly protein TadG